MAHVKGMNMERAASAFKKTIRRLAPRRAACAAAVLAVAVWAPLALAVPEGDGLMRMNPHDYGSKELCASCHRLEPPGLIFDAVTTCTKCHEGNVDDHPVARHPLGKTPRINIPPSLPLTEDGLMVCYTCHDQHNLSKHRKMLRVDFLRLCATCHVGY